MTGGLTFTTRRKATSRAPVSVTVRARQATVVVVVAAAATAPHHQPTTITTIVAAHRVATALVVMTTVVAHLLRVATTMTRARIATVHRVAALLRKTIHRLLAVATRLMTATRPRRHSVAMPSRNRTPTGTSGSSSTDVLRARGGGMAGVTIAATARLTGNYPLISYLFLLIARRSSKVSVWS